MASITIDEKLCKGCGLCANACPKKVIAFGDKRNSKGHYYPVIDVEGCIGCGTCAVVCPEAAMEIVKVEG